MIAVVILVWRLWWTQERRSYDLEFVTAVIGINNTIALQQTESRSQLEGGFLE